MAYALLAAVVVTVANTTISGLLTIDEDASFYRSVLQRATQRTWRDAARPVAIPAFSSWRSTASPSRYCAMRSPPVTCRPLAHLLKSGSHELSAWETDLSSQTGAAQAGILHGNNFNPGFAGGEGENSRS